MDWLRVRGVVWTIVVGLNIRFVLQFILILNLGSLLLRIVWLPFGVRYCSFRVYVVLGCVLSFPPTSWRLVSIATRCGADLEF
jgi:uncharacterized membrane protein YczE